MKTLAVFLFTMLMAPINAVVTSATLTKLWSWFIAKDLGPSPSFGAWYGITTILFLILGLSLSGVSKTKIEDGEHLTHAVLQTVAVSLSCVISLGFAWAIGSVTGMIA